MTRENEELTSIPAQAAHWWVAFRHGDATPAEKREFVEWVTRAPECVEASLRMARVHAALSRSDLVWPDTSAAALIRDATAAPEESVFTLPRRAGRKAEPRRRLVMPLALGLAASLLVAVGLSWFALSRPEQFQTKVGEQRSVMLADGSLVTLNTASKIEVRLRKDRRVIDLVEGEALFEVAHDAQRPFDVHVGNTTVRAVGTQFNIDRRATRTVVTVIEGRVRMVVAGASATPIPDLSAGDRVVVGTAGSGDVQHGVNLTEVTAWTRRQLVFQHRPLGEIAAEFNRYNVGRIEIRSPALQEQEVTGTFRSDDVASFVAVLAGVPGVQVTADGAGGFVVTSDASAAPRK
jgi:transmembrane sensor